MPPYDFYYQSPTEHYKAEVFLVRCFDLRFQRAVFAFLEFKNVRFYDPESPAGGAKVFFDPEEESDREYMCRELEKSVKLHHTKEVWIFLHHDCGARGSIAAFGGDRDAEFADCAKNLTAAKEFLARHFPGLAVKTFFVDDKGVIEITRLS